MMNNGPIKCRISLNKSRSFYFFRRKNLRFLFKGASIQEQLLFCKVGKISRYVSNNYDDETHDEREIYDVENKDDLTDKIWGCTK